MGDISEMMQEGILCQLCGVYIDPPPTGNLPRNCSQCDKKQKPVHIVISYIPLLMGVAGESLDTSSESVNTLIKTVCDDHPSGQVDGVLWGASPEGDPWPVFVINNADAIFEHLVQWSEESPISWFDFRLYSENGSYVIALMPRIEKSIERFRLAWELKNGIVLNKDANYNVIFKSIYFVSNPKITNTFSTIKHLLKPSVKVGFIDRSLLPGNMNPIPENIEWNQIHWIGPFEILGDYQGYLKSLLPLHKSRARKKAERKARKS